MEGFDTIVVGVGAAGMFCATQTGQLSCRVLLLDNGKKPGRRILMSDGDRCNFTNMYAEPTAHLSQNLHFHKPALTRYTQWDFIELVGKCGIAWHEKTLNQLFYDGSVEQIVNPLLAEYERGDVQIHLRSGVLSVEQDEQGYWLQVNGETLVTKKLVIASGGLSVLRSGVSPFGHRVAERPNLKVLPTCVGLVPFTLHKPLLGQLQVLSGVSMPSTITAENGTLFRGSLPFTHRGLSGPAVLQVSSHWQPDEFVTVNLLPDCNLEGFLNEQRSVHPNQSLKNTLAMQLPRWLVKYLQQLGRILDVILEQPNVRDQQMLVEALTTWHVQPNGTEGYRTAEVTLGGVDTNELSSRAIEARKAPDLYLIGEAIDVTGWLGGYSFQQAWSSAWACAQALMGG